MIGSAARCEVEEPGLIDLLRKSESVGSYTVRAWTGVATDEGVGLICLVEVTDERGTPVCRFEEFLPDRLWRAGAGWPRSQDEALQALQRRALERARLAVVSASLVATNGHRFDVPE